jgi:hypothetical protein
MAVVPCNCESEAAVKIYIDRSHCDLCQSYCDRHVAKLVRFPEGEDRPCIQAIEDDGSAQLTLIVENGAGPITLVLDERDREIVAYEGLSTFLPS